MTEKRYLEAFLKKDLNEKILIISGARQCGKTTLSRMLSKRHDYFNYYDFEDRLSIEKKTWNRSLDYIVFDELHLKKDWKKWLKALFEKEKIPPGFIVTGSARLEAFRKRTGDSLAGCFFPFRLHPFDLKEIMNVHKKPKKNKEEILDRLLQFGGFPEPYVKGTTSFYNRWQRTQVEAILREDIPELYRLQSVLGLTTLLELLRAQVGSCINHESLAKNLNCTGKTVRHWLDILENFYIIFKVLPYHKNINKSLRKMPKYYFYDIGFVREKGAKLENLVAFSLLKENHFQEDCYGKKRGLFYLRDKEKREIDFLVTESEKPTSMIEVKWSEKEVSPHFDIFSKKLPKNIQKIQVVKELKKEFSLPNQCQVKKASHWLLQL